MVADKGWPVYYVVTCNQIPLPLSVCVPVSVVMCLSPLLEKGCFGTMKVAAVLDPIVSSWASKWLLGQPGGLVWNVVVLGCTVMCSATDTVP